MIGVVDVRPCFYYTIGLWHNYKHPEIILSGLPGDASMQLINQLGAKIGHEGKSYRENIQYFDLIKNYPVEFKPIDKKHFNDFTSMATKFYGHKDYPVLQYFWVDKQGLFPWESSNQIFQAMQPDLS